MGSRKYKSQGFHWGIVFDSGECIFQIQIACKRDAVSSMDKSSKQFLNSEIYDFK